MSTYRSKTAPTGPNGKKGKFELVQVLETTESRTEVLKDGIHEMMCEEDRMV